MFLCVDVLSCLLFVVQPGALCGVLVGFIYYNENNVIKLAVLVFLILSYANILMDIMIIITTMVIQVHQLDKYSAGDTNINVIYMFIVIHIKII